LSFNSILLKKFFIIRSYAQKSDHKIWVSGNGDGLI